jgi:hypothetical protein
VERNLSLYEIHLRTGVDERTLGMLDRGICPRPSFVVLARLDMLGIPIMSWAGVPAIKEAILRRKSRKVLLAERSKRVNEYLKTHRDKRWYVKHPKKYAAMKKRRLAERKRQRAEERAQRISGGAL